MSFFNVFLIFMACLTVLNLLLILRVIGWLHLVQESRASVANAEIAPELAIGSKAPAFAAKALDGGYVGLEDFLGKSTLFIFFSNNCFRCRKEMPEIVSLSKAAISRANVSFVMVSKVGATETITWKNWLLEEDKVNIDLPFILSPYEQFDFFDMYNPRGITPYYCLIDDEGIIRARNPIGDDEWEAFKRDWLGIVRLTTAAQARARYH